MENKKVIETRDLLEAFHLHRSGNEKQAFDIYQQILGIDSNHPDFFYIIGHLAQCIREYNTAVFLFNLAIQNHPTRSRYYQGLGEIFKILRESDNALQCFQKALELDPCRVDTLVALGNMIQLQGRINEAETYYLKALAVDADCEKALIGLGNLYKKQGKVDDARNCYLKSLDLKFNPGIEIKSAFLLPVICDSNDSILNVRGNLEKKLAQLKRKNIRLSDPYAQVGTTSFHLAYHGLNNKKIQGKIASFYRETCPELVWRPNQIVNPVRDESKLSIGFISRFLHRHTIGYLNYGIIKHLNRERFHVKVFRFPGKEDELSQSIQQAADELIDLPENLKKARRIIAEQALDILFYLDIGMDPLTYFLGYSRLAPVQCATWGHADTTGIPNMDYYLSSEHAEPENAQQHYSEKLVRLSRFPMYCYFPDLPDEPIEREKAGLPNDQNLYLCPQSLFKFPPDFDVILKAILEKDPNGAIILFEGKHASWADLLRKRFARTMPGVMDRVYFHSRVPRKEFLSIVSLADVVLDTIHFNGGYTSLLCLACGVPIVTMPGHFMRGRMTQALYQQIGVPDCIVEGNQNYIDMAVTLGTDKARNRQLRRKIKSRSRSLFEDINAVNELERFFERSFEQIRKAPEYVRGR